MIEHLGEEACGIRASGETKEVNVIARGIVAHQELVKCQ